MGMFDSVGVTCPKCREVNELQSKADDCLLRWYSNLDNIPATIAYDLNNDLQTCDYCGCEFKLVITDDIPNIKRMHVEWDKD